jgi:5-methylcytosine-specific restriction protein A
MAQRAPHPCAEPGCSALIYGSGSRCEEHRLPKARQNEAQRPTSNDRGYGAEWQKIRASYLARYPWCADPYGRHEGRRYKATMVDHIRPRKYGGSDEDRNLNGLCRWCHAYKTRRDGSFEGGGGKTSKP